MELPMQFISNDQNVRTNTVKDLKKLTPNF